MTGTPAYMAPEVFRRCYGLEADLWSVGMLLYQAVAARFPFCATMEQLLGSSVEQIARVVCAAPSVPVNYGPWRRMSKEVMGFHARPRPSPLGAFALNNASCTPCSCSSLPVLFH